MVEQLKQDHVLWFLNRGSGVVLLAVLTLATALGVVATARSEASRWPRFATQALHRSVSLLAVVLVAVHAGSAVLDTYVSGYVRILPVDAVVPFLSAYEPLWLGVGVVGSDLLIAVVVTSLLRHRFPHGQWRGVHLLSYAAWGLGVLHGWRLGTDASTGWGSAVMVGCVAVVAVAVLVRLGTYRAELRADR